MKKGWTQEVAVKAKDNNQVVTFPAARGGQATSAFGGAPPAEATTTADEGEGDDEPTGWTGKKTKKNTSKKSVTKGGTKITTTTTTVTTTYTFGDGRTEVRESVATEVEEEAV